MLHDSTLALLKIDMKNALNECSHSAFFSHIADFPEISSWVGWCYSHPAELCFGLWRILVSSGVQQGDTLGPLLFSLVLMQYIDHVKLHDLVAFHGHLRYLDDGTFISLKSSLLQLLDTFTSHAPQFGLHLNLSKCELFWPSGDQTWVQIHCIVFKYKYNFQIQIRLQILLSGQYLNTNTNTFHSI